MQLCQKKSNIRRKRTEDFMTADWARLPYDVLAPISSRIVNEAPGVNRVVYDISSKPLPPSDESATTPHQLKGAII